MITSGVERVPDLMVIYGVEGVGKTTFASKASKALFLDLEGGSKRVPGVKRVGSDFTALSQVWLFLNWFYESDHGFETLVIDSLSEFERMAHAQTCQEEGVAHIEDVGGGFNKGYTVALKQWSLLREGIKRIQQKRGSNVIFIGHADVRTFTDPTTNSSYDRYQLKLGKPAGAFMREWVDFIGFSNFQTWTKGKENAAKHKAFGSEKRRLFTERRPAWDAKNRLGLPLEMEFSYEAYSKAAHASDQEKAAVLRANVDELIKQVKDPAKAQAMRDFVAKAGDNPTDLAMIQERVRARLDEQEEPTDGGQQ
jgi:hypothetical protein